MLSTNIYVLIGKRLVDWRNLMEETSKEYLTWMPRDYDTQLWQSRLLEDAPTTARLSGTLEFRSLQPMELGYWRLLEMLDSTRGFGCSGTRDKLFALLGLFARPVPKLLYLDYRKSVTEVFTDLAWFLVDSDTPEALSEACSEESSGELPSWVADWRTNRRLQRFERLDSSCSAGYSFGHKRIYAKRDGGVLILRGVLGGEVQAINETWRSRFQGHREAYQPNRDNDGESELVEEYEAILAHRRKWTCKMCHGLESNRLIAFENLLMPSTLSDCTAFDSQMRRPAYGAPGPESVSNRRYRDAIRVCAGRRDFICKDGRVGIGPPSAREGDTVCVFLGLEFPLLLRKHESIWRIVGQCMLEGIMRGEAVADLNWDTIEEGELVEPLEDFRIV